jgi:DNA-binding transcriptional LysR family regulator
MGISLLSLHTVGLELAAGRLVTLDVQGLPIVRNWYVVHLAQKRLSPVARALKGFLLSEAAKLLAGQDVPYRGDRRASGRKARAI